MIKKIKLEKLELAKQKLSSELVILLCMLAFILIFLVIVAPKQRMAPTPTTAHIPLGSLLVKAGAWLPNDLHLSPDLYSSQISTGNIEFLLLIAVAFGVYGLCALFLHRQYSSKNSTTLLLIGVGAAVAGLFMVFSPSLRSHDIFAYAGYGRMMVTYHANPYFVTLSAFPRDPLYPLDDWAQYTAAGYGPFWTVICALSVLFSGAHPLRYVIFFRVLGLAAHLVNILLVATILRKMGRSPRTVTLGTLLYAWNPLALLESSESGHNDIFMITFILLGILFAIRAEKRGFADLRNYLLPIVAFTLAALVKFTTIALVVLFIIALAYYALRPTASTLIRFRESLSLRWKPALVTLLSASGISGIVVLFFYGPFFIGHSLHAIVAALPSPHSVHKSLLNWIIQWSLRHPLPVHALSRAMVSLLSNPNLSDDINIVTLAIAVVIGAIWLWKRPTVRTFILASIVALGALLVVSAWFGPWYLTWLVALAAVCLPVMHDRIAGALVAFSLIFSASSFIFYLYNGYPPAGVGGAFSNVLTHGPPLLAFLIFIIGWRSINQPIKQLTQDVETVDISA